MAPTEMLFERRHSSNAPMQRQWVHRSPSSDSVSTTTSQPTPASPNSSHQSLRKRASNYMRIPDRSTSPIPEMPPQRPPRNPARPTSSNPSKPASRPSSSRSAREDVTPWDFQTPLLTEERPRLRSGAPSVRSKASSLGLGGAATGPVEDVTPWELYPAPDFNAAPSLSSVVLAQTPSAPPPKTLHPTTLTGLVEDVTPWELHPEPDLKPRTYAQSSPYTISAYPRSKPPSILSNSSAHGFRASTATGPTEEVTPWELQPSPTTEQQLTDLEKNVLQAAQQRNSLTLSKAQLEEVMPWELYPAPPLPLVSGSASATHRQSISNSRSTPSSKTLVDFTLRHRRSGGSKASKAARSHSHSSSKPQSRINSSQAISNNSIPTMRQASPHASKSVSTPSLPPSDCTLADASSVVSARSNRPNGTTKQKPQFSTADRTILEELKRNMNARAAQFLMKGVGVYLTDGSVSRGKRHHPYSRRDAPYPRNYDREVIDLDVWETLYCQEMRDSLTWHVFDKPPRKVLDIGCGTGTWILNCARTWRETQFVGLDIVPLQPDLQQIGSIDYASRITWVQANFLEGLPFPNDEFDFVYIKRIALGVPEDKWDALFDEISRVMKPGATLEMVEEDLLFPGKQVEKDEQTDLASPVSRSSSTASTSSPNHRVSFKPRDSIPPQSEFTLAPGQPGVVGPISRPASPEANPRVSFCLDADTVGKGSATSTTPPGSPHPYVTLIAPHSRSTARPALYLRTNSSTGFSFTSTSPPKSINSSLFTGSAASLLNSLAHHPFDENHLFRRRRSSTNLSSLPDVMAPVLAPGQVPLQLYHTSPADGHVNAARSSSVKTETFKAPLFLLRTPAKPPANPRDHSMLEYIYNETLSSRFINTSPISLLMTYLEYHFKDAHSFPPIVYNFPPVPIRTGLVVDSEDEEEHEDDPQSVASQPDSPHVPATSVQRSPLSDENGELLEQHRWATAQDLLRRSSPYVSFDRSKGFAATKSASRTKDTKASRPDRCSAMMNRPLNIDLRSLNLHLTLRAKEVLACSESMWEWIRETQKAWVEEKEAQRRKGRRSVEVHRQQVHGNDQRNMVLEMTREDFNQLLLNFEMDMQDQTSLASALTQRFHWPVIDSAPPVNRKIFNTACEKYEKWRRKEQRPPTLFSAYPSSISVFEKTSISITAPTPDTPVPSEMARARSNSQSILFNRPNGLSPLTPQKSEGSSIHFASTPSLAAAAAASSPPPTQKVSRTMTVFVAWKPEDPQS